MTLRKVIRLIIPILLISVLLQTLAYAESCETVVNAVNAGLSPRIDERELVEVLRSLNSSHNKKLPPAFVTKKEAKALGWKPGKNPWSVSTLKGSSIGGDRFNNREGRLPGKKWREADLDYKGGHRGGKRLIFSRDGARFVTVDHYRTFVEVPACQ